MDFQNKLKTFILLVLIINALTIVRIPIREFYNFIFDHSEDFRTKLHKRYEPLLPLLGVKMNIGHFVKLNDKNDHDPTIEYARHSMLRYILAPRNVVEISNPDFFTNDEGTQNKEWDLHKQPEVFIYEGIPENRILEKYPYFIKVNKNLYILNQT